MSLSWDGRERKRLRDRARMRAMQTVSRSHRSEHREAYRAEVGGSQQARWNRALATVARRHPEEFRTALALELHPCSSQSPAATIGPENECIPAVGTDRDAIPNLCERSEMVERTHPVTAGEVR